jgi:hypothetical protein
VFKSLDQGVTWQPLLTFNTTTEIDLVYVNHLNYIFTSPTPGSTNELGIWRSTNGGTQWTHVLSLPSGCNIWSMTEDSSGNLFAGVYTSGSPLADARIYKSIDGGATWTTVYYDSVARHVHCVYIDPTDNYIYASIGDAISPWSTNYLLRSTDDGNTWSKILSGIPQIVAITSVSGARLFATDQSSPADGQIYRTTDDKSYSRVYDVGAPAYGFWFRTNTLNGYIYASFVSNEISKTAGIYVSTNNGVTWTTYKMFAVPTGGYFGSPIASNFMQGIMYYSVMLSNGYQNGIKIYPVYGTSNIQVNAPLLAGALLQLSATTLQQTLLRLSSVSLTIALAIGFYKTRKQIKFALTPTTR